MSGKTSTQSKEKYNKANYARYSFRVRQDDALNDDIKNFCAQNGTSLSFLVTKLLREHFLTAEEEP